MKLSYYFSEIRNSLCITYCVLLEHHFNFKHKSTKISNSCFLANLYSTVSQEKNNCTKIHVFVKVSFFGKYENGFSVKLLVP